MSNWLMRGVAFAGTLVAWPGVFSSRDETLHDWALPGGMEEVQATLVSRLRTALEYARRSNAYYAGRLASAGFDPMTIRALEDMGGLPVLTKADIVQHRSEFQECESSIPRRVQATTGGSTGQPLAFSMSRDDYVRSVGVGLAGWQLAGHVLGDRMGIFGGASLASMDAVPWHPSLSDVVLNRRQFSTTALDDDHIARYWEYIERWKPEYIRGYPFALAQFCRHRPKRDMNSYRPKAVLTTSEMLTASARAIIEATFDAPVFDAWGLNDGGAAAYECSEHNGMHVDITRAYVETVDDGGRPVWGVPGRIVVTSLTNRAFPFVRYDTGDVGVLTWRDCGCGRSGLMLTQILGRADERLDLGGVRTEACANDWLLNTDRMRRWRIVQDAPLHLTMVFDVDPGFDREASEEAVMRSFRSRCSEVSITFVYEALPLPADGSKWRSVVVLDSARSEARTQSPAGTTDM